MESPGGWAEYLRKEIFGEYLSHLPGHGDLASLRPRPTDGALVHHEARRRLRMLQYFNLWHEDRTAAVEGVESRVPFLDHRLVEFLASVPPARHEALFWDKRIVRDMARAWLPDSTATRRKVGFFQDDDMRPVESFLRAVVMRNIDEFRARYLEGADALWDRDAFDRLVGAAQSVARHRASSLEALVRCVCISIFHRMCNDISRFSREPFERGPILQEIAEVPPTWVEPPQVTEPSAWGPHDRAVIESGTWVARQVGAPDGVILALGTGTAVGEFLEVPDEALVVLLEHVIGAAEPPTVADLAAALGTTHDDVGFALQFFAERGWVTRLDPIE
jgi:hypothetical protein